MRKAQIQHVFIYMMAILVIGFLLLFGYRAIDRLMGQKCVVEQAEFSTGMARSIDGSMRYNSVTQANVQAPCDYDALCLVDARAIGATWTTGNPFAEYPVISADMSDGIQTNIYMIDGKTTVPMGFDARIRTSSAPTLSDDALLCVQKRNGLFSFILKGDGNTVIATVGTG